MPVALPPPDPGFEILVSSTGMSQGTALTESVQLFPRAFVQIGSVRACAQWRNVSSPAASGVAALFLRFGPKVGPVQLEGGATYRMRTGANGSPHPTSWELSAGARGGFGRLGLRALATYSPREFANGKSLYVELRPAFGIGKSTTVSASIGRREREGESDYTSFDTGISRVLKQRLTLDARYYGTDRAELGWRYRGRIVVSARLAL